MAQVLDYSDASQPELISVERLDSGVRVHIAATGLRSVPTWRWANLAVQGFNLPLLYVNLWLSPGMMGLDWFIVVLLILLAGVLVAGIWQILHLAHRVVSFELTSNVLTRTSVSRFWTSRKQWRLSAFKAIVVSELHGGMFGFASTYELKLRSSRGNHAQLLAGSDRGRLESIAAVLREYWPAETAGVASS